MLLRQGKVDDARKRSGRDPRGGAWRVLDPPRVDLLTTARRTTRPPHPRLEAWLAIQPDSAEAKGLLAALP